MDLKTFLENFDAIAEAPGGIPKLRSLIVDLAVRGKLASQNPGDEPATVLLEKVALIKEEVAEWEGISKEKTLTPIEEHEYFYDLPSGWSYTRLGEISFFLNGYAFKSNTYVSNSIYQTIRLGNVKNDMILLDQNPAFIPDNIASENQKFLIRENDILITMTGTKSKRDFCFTAVVESNKFNNKKLYLNQRVGCIRVVTPIFIKLINIFLKSSIIVDFLLATATGTANQANIGAVALRNLPIPLPPLAEQKRIVEKVDELMGLCDRYEVGKQTRDNLRQQLRASVIASLMNAETDEELDAAWAFVRDNWHNISQHPEDIDSLRQTILHLAVRGKLVLQNPDDEPAEKLLKVIATKHASYAKNFRKPKGLPSLKDVDKPFELPFGWSWCRFTEIGQLDRGKSKHRPRNDSLLYENGSIPLVQTGDVARANGVIETYTALYNHQGLAQSRLWSKGTLCITIAANIGDSAILGFDACFPDSIVGFLPTEPISDSRYFEFLIRTLKSRLEDFAPSTAQKNINLGILDEVLIPLPPLAEQKRIVAKVDELMQLCDQLEASLRQSQQRAESLAASAISHLTI